ncbi:MAG: ATP-binding protein [Actinomycetes bacterium]
MPLSVPETTQNTTICEDFLVICDEDGTIAEITQGALDVIGRSEHELISSNIADIVYGVEIPAGTATGQRGALHPNGCQVGVPGTLLGQSPIGNDFLFSVVTLPVLSHGPDSYAVLLPRAGRSSGDSEILAPSGARTDPGDAERTETLSRDVELDLSRRLVKNVEVELARASLEIHDGVAQSMSNAIQLLETLNSSPNMTKNESDLLARVRLLLRRGIADARSISRELMPASLERIGFAKTLKFELENLAIVGVVSSFDFDAPDEIPLEVQTTLYRVASEALLNVKKHAKASLVAFSITTDGVVVSMSIHDDGIGFDDVSTSNYDQTQLGVVSMRARVVLMGGTFSLVSGPSQGTAITVRLPLLVRNQ